MKPAAQLDLLAGEEARDRGIHLVAINGAAFLERARAAARSMAEMFGEVSCDDIREWASVEGIKPHHRNVWGALFADSAWVCVGRRPSRLVSNHGREIKTWRLR